MAENTDDVIGEARIEKSTQNSLVAHNVFPAKCEYVELVEDRTSNEHAAEGKSKTTKSY